MSSNASKQTLGAGQESVWDYPRPPRLEAVSKRIRVVFDGITIAESTRSMRVLETSHPPTYYFPPEDVCRDLLVPTSRRSFCEWKGTASYFDIVTPNRTSSEAVWSYPKPSPRFHEIAGYLAFYPSRVDACNVDEERVQCQAGDFYGGWITSKIVGPFKGGPGTFGW